MINPETRLNRRQLLGLGGDLFRGVIAYNLIERGGRCITPRSTESAQQCNDMIEGSFMMSSTTRQEQKQLLSRIFRSIPGEQSSLENYELPDPLFDRGIPAFSLGLGAVLAIRTVRDIRSRFTTPDTEQPTN